jgi:hypothetical protein
LPDYVKLVFDLAKKNNKRVRLRIQMRAPHYKHQAALPDFVLDIVPTVDLIPVEKERKAAARFIENQYSRYQPRFDHPFFQRAFSELVGLLAAEFNGNPSVEFVDTFLYGFWAEGHSWPIVNTPFPNYQTAGKTWVKMLEVQQKHSTKTPLMTNTQPDYSRVGNSEVLDLTIRSHNWIRSDTIFIENEQIETLCNRPPWIAAALEQGTPAKGPDSFPLEEGPITGGKHDCSCKRRGGELLVALEPSRDQSQESAGLLPAFPKSFDQINRRIGYRVRPSMILSYDDGGHLGLIVALANDRIAGVPGVLSGDRRERRRQNSDERMPGSWLSPARRAPAGAICAAQRNKICRFETQSEDGRERYALPSPMGLSAEAQRGWLTDSAF